MLTRRGRGLFGLSPSLGCSAGLSPSAGLSAGFSPSAGLLSAGFAPSAGFDSAGFSPSAGLGVSAGLLSPLDEGVLEEDAELDAPAEPVASFVEPDSGAFSTGFAVSMGFCSIVTLPVGSISPV